MRRGDRDDTDVSFRIPLRGTCPKRSRCCGIIARAARRQWRNPNGNWVSGRGQVEPIEIQPAQLDRPLGRVGPGRRLNRIVKVVVAVGGEPICAVAGCKRFFGAPHAARPDGRVLSLVRAQELGIIGVGRMERRELARPQDHAPQILLPRRAGSRAEDRMGVPRAIEHDLRHGPQRRSTLAARLAEQTHREQNYGVLLADWLLGVGNRRVNSSVALPGFVLPLPHHESSFSDGETRSKETLPRIPREPNKPNKPRERREPREPREPRKLRRPRESDGEEFRVWNRMPNPR